MMIVRLFDILPGYLGIAVAMSMAMALWKKNIGNGMRDVYPMPKGVGLGILV
jgi:hypothetical protein